MNLRHVVRVQVAVDVKVWCTGVLFIHIGEVLNLGLGASYDKGDNTFVFAKIDSMGFTKLLNVRNTFQQFRFAPKHYSKSSWD